jgi:hypothetical protein
MPNFVEAFERAFQEGRGDKIQYNGHELIGIDRVPVGKKFRGYLRILSTNSNWEQGLVLQVKGKLTQNGKTHPSFRIWAYGYPGPIYFEGTSKDNTLLVWNVWENGSREIDRWTGGAAMILEIDDNIRRYRCNDGHPDDNFDDIIFEIEILEDEK